MGKLKKGSKLWGTEQERGKTDKNYMVFLSLFLDAWATKKKRRKNIKLTKQKGKGNTKWKKGENMAEKQVIKLEGMNLKKHCYNVLKEEPK